MEDIHRYLNGEMSQAERRRFELALADDHDLQAELKVHEGLRQLRLQKKVDEVAAARNHWEWQRYWQRILMVFALVLLVLAFFVLLKKQDAPPSSQWPPVAPPPAVEPSPILEKETFEPVFPDKEAAQPKPQSIARVKPPKEPSLPTYPAPSVRGEGSENEARQALLDKIWYADYPPAGIVPGKQFEQADILLRDTNFNNAYVELQRLERTNLPNDTLRLLKGYCLMEMGEGADALIYFEKLEDRQPAWVPQLQWYRGLSLLLSGDNAGALSAFKKIASTPKHPYRKQGERATRLLE